jgi:hypothetical protein
MPSSSREEPTVRKTLTVATSFLPLSMTFYATKRGAAQFLSSM